MIFKLFLVSALMMSYEADGATKQTAQCTKDKCATPTNSNVNNINVKVNSSSNSKVRKSYSRGHSTTSSSSVTKEIQVVKPQVVMCKSTNSTRILVIKKKDHACHRQLRAKTKAYRLLESKKSKKVTKTVYKKRNQWGLGLLFGASEGHMQRRDEKYSNNLTWDRYFEPSLGALLQLPLGESVSVQFQGHVALESGSLSGAHVGLIWHP